jgi:predicted secreted protein
MVSSMSVGYGVITFWNHSAQSGGEQAIAQVYRGLDQ